MPLTIKELLHEPFGPYPEHKLFSESLKPSKKQPLVLNDLELILDGKLSGLDDTESLTTDRDVKFLGVVELSSLAWLSCTGHETLRKDVLERTEIRLDSVYNKDRPANGLTVKVVVIGEKRLNVRYIGSSPVLWLLSEYRREDGTVHRRNWEVESMLDHTYAKSRLYLRRWRFRNLIHMFSSQFNTPPTCRWLMQAYMRNSHSDAVYVESPEVRSMFNLHAEWMLEEQAKTSGKRFIDQESWKQFLQRPDGVDLEDVETSEREGLETPRLTRSARKAQSIIRLDSSSPVPESPPIYYDQKIREDYAEDLDDESEQPSSEHSSPSPEPPVLVDPKIYGIIPSSFYEEVQIPMDFRWLCDTGLCSYAIDLLDLSDDNLKDVIPREIDFLEEQEWTLADSHLQDLFRRMVHNHRVDHLHSWNIGVRETGEPKFYWIKPAPIQGSRSQFAAMDHLKKEDNSL